MQSHGRVEIELQAFLTSVLDWGKWSASVSDPGTHRVEIRAGTTAGLGAVARSKSALCGSRTLVLQHIASLLHRSSCLDLVSQHTYKMTAEYIHLTTLSNLETLNSNSFFIVFFYLSILIGHTLYILESDRFFAWFYSRENSLAPISNQWGSYSLWIENINFSKGFPFYSYFVPFTYEKETESKR
jgi:hypothetical protein